MRIQTCILWCADGVAYALHEGCPIHKVNLDGCLGCSLGCQILSPSLPVTHVWCKVVVVKCFSSLLLPPLLIVSAGSSLTWANLRKAIGGCAGSGSGMAISLPLTTAGYGWPSGRLLEVSMGGTEISTPHFHCCHYHWLLPTGSPITSLWIQKSKLPRGSDCLR